MWPRPWYMAADSSTARTSCKRGGLWVWETDMPQQGSFATVMPFDWNRAGSRKLGGTTSTLTRMCMCEH